MHIKCKYACQFCGFKAKKYQKIIDRNGYYSTKGKQSDFITVCPLCEVSHRLSKFCNKNIGRLVYLPELTQSEVNHIYHLYWASLCFQNMTTKHEKIFDDDEKTFVDMIKSFIGYIEKRNTPAIKAYGEGINDFVTIADVLFSLPDEYYINRKQIFKHLRYIPNKDFFEQERAYYEASIYPNLNTDNRKAFKEYLVKLS